MVKMEFGQMAQNPMMTQQGNQMPGNQMPGNQMPGNQMPGNQMPGNQMAVPVQQMQPDSMQQPLSMPMQQNDFNKIMQQRMKLNPQAQVMVHVH